MLINILIILIITVAVISSLRSSIRHFRGEGGCCGGGNSIIEEDKKLSEKEIGKKVIEVSGMTCDNCRKRVKNALNRIDGVEAEVNLKKGTAVIHYSREISDEELAEAVEKAGYSLKRGKMYGG